MTDELLEATNLERVSVRDQDPEPATLVRDHTAAIVRFVRDEDHPILALIIKGHTAVEIASVLHLTPRVIEGRMRRIRRRVRRGVRHGTLPSPPRVRPIQRPQSSTFARSAQCLTGTGGK